MSRGSAVLAGVILITALGVGGPAAARSPGLSGRAPSSGGGERASGKVRAAASDTITFDDVGYVTVTDQYRAQGVIFTSNVFITDDVANPTAPALTGYPQFFGPIRGEFVLPGQTDPAALASFSFDVGYINDPGSVAVDLFDLAGTKLGSVPVNGTGMVHMVISKPGMHAFKVHAVGSERAGFAIDNLLAWDSSIPRPKIMAFWQGGRSFSFTSWASLGADSFTWKFGDGQSSNDADTTHAYARSGEKMVRLTAFRAGKAATVSMMVAADPPTVYAPFVWLASGDKLKPSSVPRYLSYARLRWRHDQPCAAHDVAGPGVAPNKLGTGIYKHKVDDALCHHTGRDYLDTEAVAPGHAGAQPDGETDEGFFLDIDGHAAARNGGDPATTPAYYQVIERDGFRYVVYWFFYAYNNKVNVHEGDWEHIAVRLSPTGYATHVAYYQHTCDGKVFDRAAGMRALDGSRARLAEETHPIVFSARGSHASWWKVGDHQICWDGVKPEGDDSTSQGTAWKTWESGLVRITNQKWYAYGGLWGPWRAVPINRGPVGPAFQDPFKGGWGIAVAGRPKAR